MYLAIPIITQNQIDVMTVQQCFKEGESAIDWDNEFQSLFIVIMKIGSCVQCSIANVHL